MDTALAPRATTWSRTFWALARTTWSVSLGLFSQ